MEKATPVQIRQSLELADHLKRAGIRFVPIPVFDEEDWIEQTKVQMIAPIYMAGLERIWQA